MRRLFCSFAFASFLFLFTSAFAQEAGSKIYIVDMQRVITESIIGKAAQSDLQDDAKKRELKLDQANAEMKKLGGELEKQASLLSKEALDQKKDEALKKQREFERAVQDNREGLARKRDEALKKVVEQARKCIGELSGSKNYRFILERDPQLLLYVDPSLDITEEVIKTLDSKKLSS